MRTPQEQIRGLLAKQTKRIDRLIQCYHLSPDDRWVCRGKNNADVLDIIIDRLPDKALSLFDTFVKQCNHLFALPPRVDAVGTESPQYHHFFDWLNLLVSGISSFPASTPLFAVFKSWVEGTTNHPCKDCTPVIMQRCSDCQLVLPNYCASTEAKNWLRCPGCDSDRLEWRNLSTDYWAFYPHGRPDHEKKSRKKSKNV